MAYLFDLIVLSILKDPLTFAQNFNCNWINYGVHFLQFWRHLIKQLFVILLQYDQHPLIYAHVYLERSRSSKAY